MLAQHRKKWDEGESEKELVEEGNGVACKVHARDLTVAVTLIVACQPGLQNGIDALTSRGGALVGGSDWTGKERIHIYGGPPRRVNTNKMSLITVYVRTDLSLIDTGVFGGVVI